jgi:hypothetical protein
VNLLNLLKDILILLNLGTFDEKLKTYYLTYNATIYIMDICQMLRKSVFASLTIDYLAYSIVSLEGNILLIAVKYLEWRVKFYLELAHVYEEIGSL